MPRTRIPPCTPVPAGRIGLRALGWLLLALSVTPALAEPCRPAAPLRHVASSPRPDFLHGLLWKIETSNSSPSYLFGTFHSGDPRITTLPCPVQEAFDHAGSYTMEVIMNGSGLVSMAEAMFFSDGQTLQQTVGEPLYRETLRTLGIDDPQQAASINTMKPWAVMMTLAGPRKRGGLFLDMALQARATRQGKATYGLETMQEQIAVFNGMSLDDQVVLLRDAVETVGLSGGAMEQLAQAYLRRDLAALQSLQEKHKPADARVYDDMMRRLLTQRNRAMAERMRPRLREGNAFIAVGALHLPGNDGLLRLLTGDGYRVSRLY
jgi:hypothetical protein